MPFFVYLHNSVLCPLLTECPTNIIMESPGSELGSTPSFLQLPREKWGGTFYVSLSCCADMTIMAYVLAGVERGFDLYMDTAA